MKKVLTISLLFVAISSITKAQPRVTKSNNQPNVVFILTDDHRYDGAKALGNGELITPHLDALIKSGTLFTQAHILGSDQPAVCAPSRAMLLTGKAYYHLPMELYSSQLKHAADTVPSYITMPQHFKQQGYYTYMTGKWHNSRKSFQKSFDSAENIFFGGMHFEGEGGHEHPNLHHYNSDGVYNKNNSFKGDKFSSILYADAAVNFLQTYKENQPFFLYVAFTSPHDPRTPYSPFKEKYDADKIALPANFLPQHPFDNGELAVRDEALLPQPRSASAVQKEIAAYYAMISEVDAQVGRIVEALKASGYADNTIIVWAGDNGLAVGQHGLLGKQNLYDHSIRVPLLFAGNNIPKGKRSDALTYLHDTFPTLCELAGLPLPYGLDGESLAPVIKGQKKKHRSQLWFTYKNPMQTGIRTEEGLKLIRYEVKGKERYQLFDLKKDPMEKNDVATDPAYKTKLAALKSLLQQQSSLAVAAK